MDENSSQRQGALKFTEQEPSLERPSRPLGVTLLIVWDGLILGLVPIVSTTLAAASGAITGDLGIYINVLLNTMIISAAIGTFLGSDRARLALIYLVTIYFAIESFTTLTGMFQPGQTAVDQGIGITRLINAALWIGLHLYYFFRAETIQYYRRPLLRNK